MNRTSIKTKAIGVNFRVPAWFLLFGTLSGFLFALLLSRDSLQSFFFQKGDKFVIPRYSYWCALSLIQLIGLAAAYAVCVARRSIVQPISQVRLLPAALIIALATPLLYALTPVMNERIDLNWDFVVAPLTFLFLLACALCLLTGNFKLVPVAFIWNLLFTALALGLICLCVRIVGSRDSYEFIEWPVLYAMLGLSFGSWLTGINVWNSLKKVD